MGDFAAEASKNLLSVESRSDLLVRDFMRFQKANGNPQDRFGKLKSYLDFIALQSSLALFNSRKDSLKDILKNVRLINNKSGNHPFLEDALKRSGALSSIDGFFKAYLDERLEWLRCADGPDAYQLRKLYERGEKKRKAAKGAPSANVYLGEMAKRFLDESVCLPRGLFDGLVRSALKELYPDQYERDVPDCWRRRFWITRKRSLTLQSPLSNSSRRIGSPFRRVRFSPFQAKFK